MMEEAYSNSSANISYMDKYRKGQIESVEKIESGTSEGVGPPKSINGYEKIKKFREKAGLRPYSIDSGDTVASVTVNNKTYFGVNSTITKESQKSSKALRQKWLKEIEWVPPKRTALKHLGHAQSLTHAESHSLIRAFERHGSLPKKVRMYIDRKTCNICRDELPALLKRLGVDELEIFSGGTTKPIIIKATK